MQFQEPRAKLWLFDTLATPTLLYRVKTWGPSVPKVNNWRDLNRFLVSINASMIESKASLPYDIIQVEMGTTPILTKALF